MNQHTKLINRVLRIRVNIKTGCWEWTGHVSFRSGGDKRPRLRHNGKTTCAYRLSWELFRGPIPPGFFVCHHCDNPICLNPTHLFLGTASDNARDCVSKGRHASKTHPEKFKELAARLGRKNTWSKNRMGRSVIPHRDIPSIRERLASGESLMQLANTYGVSKQAVSQFLRRDKERARAALAKARGE